MLGLHLYPGRFSLTLPDTLPCKWRMLVLSISESAAQSLALWLWGQSACLARRKPCVGTPALPKPGSVVQACKPSTRQVESGRSRVQEHPPYFKVSLRPAWNT